MSFFNGMDADEREGLYALVNMLLEKIDLQRRLNEDLVRQLECERERLAIITMTSYGVL